MAVSLSGYIFFGSSVKINKRVRKLVQSMVDDHPPDVRGNDAATTPTPRVDRTRSIENALPGVGSQKALRMELAVSSAPKFVLLDFRRVHGLDATAARSFSTLFRRLQMLGVELIITHLPPAR